MRVFLSYRRGEAGGHAGRLHDALVQRLGSSGVFLDVSAITPGEDFTAAIDEALVGSDVVLAVIGPTWLTVAGPDGRPRLQHPDDYVRLELAGAFERELPVVPVLVGGATLPSPEDLPAELAALPRHQGVALRDESWHQDVDGLVRVLRGEPAAPVRRRRLQGAAIGALLLILAVGAASWWLRPGSVGDGDVGPESCDRWEEGEWTGLALADDPTVRVIDDNGDFGFAVRRGRWREVEPGRWMVLLDVAFTNHMPGEAAHPYWYYEALVVGQRSFELTCFSGGVEVVLPRTTGDALAGFAVSCEPVGHIELRVGDVGPLQGLDVTGGTAPGEC